MKTRFQSISLLKQGFFACSILLFSTGLNFAQNNTLMLNGASIIMNGGTQAKPIYLIVNQPDNQAIVRNSGHIQSESQYNFVKWDSGIERGEYVFPFGKGNNYTPLSFNKTSANNTSIQASTWATDQANNPRPGVSSVNPVTDMSGEIDANTYAIDRFWDIYAESGTVADLTFSYLGSENTVANPLENVKGHHWNGTSWSDAISSSNSGVTSGVGTAGPFVGQTSFSPWVLTVNKPLGIAENELKNNITIYPNPTNDFVYIKVNQNEKIESIQVYDALGKIVSVTTSPAGNEQIIDFNSISKGIYLVKLKTDKQIVSSTVVKE